MKRLSKHQRWARVHSQIERNLATAMTELNRLSEKLEISPLVKERAALIYRKALKKNLLRGRLISAFIAACLYAACRQFGLTKTLDEIANISLVDKKKIGRCYRLLIKEFGLRMPLQNPISWISKIAEKIGISQKIQGRAIKILYKAKEKHIWKGKNPVGLAAAALYIASLENNEDKESDWYTIHLKYSERKTQKDIAQAAGITEVTLRNRYREIEKKLGLELPRN